VLGLQKVVRKNNEIAVGPLASFNPAMAITIPHEEMLARFGADVLVDQCATASFITPM